MNRIVYCRIVLLFCFMMINACPEPPENKPQKADCPIGKSPCADDSTVCCWDTTSHNFVWEIDTLGMQGGDNWLMDAAITDENNIWVVGELHSDSGLFSGAVWDGEEWSLIKLDGQWGTISPRGIFAFDQNLIWIVNGGTIYKWESDSLYIQWESDWQNGELDVVRYIWGSSLDDIFFIGNEGTIVHYDGTAFERMNSGTDVDLRSISGTSADNVWVSGWNYDDLHRILLHYDGNVWNKIIDDNSDIEGQDRIEGRIVGVYTDNTDNVWVLTHKGLYNCNNNTIDDCQWFGDKSDPTSWIYAFDGSNHNDLFYGGAFTRLWHYNGSTFHYYDDIPDMGRIYGIDVTESVITIVGELINTSQAFVLRGYR